MKYYLAIDLGATSGRHILGYSKNGQIITKEIHRFPTKMDNSPDGLVWNIERIYNEILIGIKKAFLISKEIVSLAIDSWGVDYVLINGDKSITPYYAYRNTRNENSSKKLHSLIPFEELYKANGLQFATFNTIYQLYDDLNKGRLDNATDYLMIPSYFSYRLTGIKTHEYTNESTTGLLNPFTKDYNYELIDKIGLPRKLFNKINKPGEIVGRLTPEVEKIVGGNLDVKLCASHDTASAFESISNPNDSIVLSSGTWSLLGIKSDTPVINELTMKYGFTNEGGINYIRFLKNIMGMWIPNEVAKANKSHIEVLIPEIKKSKFEEVFDVNDPSLFAPSNMEEAIIKLLKTKPNNINDLFSSIFHSLAKSYANGVKELEQIFNKEFSSIYIIGGGANNTLLNDLTEKYTKKKVYAVPNEATSIGNIKIQMNECNK